MTSIENFAESIGILYLQFMNEQLNLNDFQLEFNKEYQQAKEMHYKELMDSMQKGMKIQQKYDSRKSFRERNNLLNDKTNG